jgi:hypothetical protein
MPNAEKPRVFISCARRNGESWAHHIRSDLTKAGVEVWLDTMRIDGGVSWSKEIEDGLALYDAVVAILSALVVVGGIPGSVGQQTGNAAAVQT